MIENTSKLNTEKSNENSKNLDQLSTIEILQVINNEDQKVALTVKEELKSIEHVVDEVVDKIKNGGRCIYFGAGTSGRLGILDASECPPTFSTTTEIIGIMAGGDRALRKAVEGAEDSHALAVEDLKELGLCAKDILIGIAASGRTPYVIGGLEYAKSIGCKSVAISCNKDSLISTYADLAIEIGVGSEVLTGSTRMKSGTAQKLVLNMISTSSMIKLGKVYGNRMVDVNPTNEKLVQRATRIVSDISNCDEKLALETLKVAEFNSKLAIVMIVKQCSLDVAKNLLINADGFLRKVIES